MAFRLKLEPKLILPFLGGLVAVEFSPGSVALEDGPPVSNSRYEQGSKLADETVAALSDSDLSLAVERLLALAHEYPTEKRGAALEMALQVAHRARLLKEASGALSAEREDDRREDVIGLILDAVAEYRAMADMASPPSVHHGETDQEMSPSGSDAPSGRPLESDLDSARGPIAIRCTEVAWRAGNRWILSNVNVNLAAGAIIGVVGRNAAGKTTLLRLLGQDLAHSYGSLEYPALSERGYSAQAVLDRITYVPDAPIEYSGTLRRHLTLFAALRGLRGDDLEREVAFALERLELVDQADAPWSALTGGMRTRVDLARATLANPEILILDEPLGRLDDGARTKYLRYLRDLADSRRGTCVVITSQVSHYLEDLADYMLVVEAGQITFAGEPAQLKALMPRRVFEFSTESDAPDLVGALSALSVVEVHSSQRMHRVIAGAETSAVDVVRALLDAGVAIRYFRDLSGSPEQLLAGSSSTPGEGRRDER